MEIKVKLNLLKIDQGMTLGTLSIVIKFLRELKWKPKVKFDEGLKKTVIWYLNNKNFFNKIKNKNYEKRLGLKL